MSGETSFDNNPQFKLKKQIAVFLISDHWNCVSDLDLAISIAISTKDYQTAVGIKTVHMALLPSSDNSFKICGEYQSQGTNILVNYYFEITNDMSLNDIKVGVRSLARTFDSVISESYARRLFLRESY